jgi:hypothetical protein
MFSTYDADVVFLVSGFILKFYRTIIDHSSVHGQTKANVGAARCLMSAILSVELSQTSQGAKQVVRFPLLISTTVFRFVMCSWGCGAPLRASDEAPGSPLDPHRSDRTTHEARRLANGAIKSIMGLYENVDKHGMRLNSNNSSRK